MKVTKIDENTYQVRIDELLPCRDFHCVHELMSCATKVLCPDGTFDTNRYCGICLDMTCMDCVYYPDRCKFGKKHPDWNFIQKELTGIDPQPLGTIEQTLSE